MLGAATVCGGTHDPPRSVLSGSDCNGVATHYIGTGRSQAANCRLGPEVCAGEASGPEEEEGGSPFLAQAMKSWEKTPPLTCTDTGARYWD